MACRIDDIFARLRAEGRTALIPFVTAGYPSLEVTAEVVPALETAGASIVELGIPFSDPIADGPVIAASMHEALQAGVTPGAVFNIVGQLRQATSVGLVAMVSDSIVQRMGPQQFLADAAKAGFDGLIIPDLDLTGAPAVAELAAGHGMTLSLLIAPTTPDDRIERIVGLCSGFVYVLARAGITGERDTTPDIAARVESVRRHTDLPIAVGFGISEPEHVSAVTELADAAIVGSAIVRRMGPDGKAVSAAADFARTLAAALTNRSRSDAQ